MSYIGVIEHIWELDYAMFRVPMFQCKWVDNNYGVETDDLGFIRVNFNKLGYKDDAYILASQARQVFYVTDPYDVNWSVVLLTNKKIGYGIDDHANEVADIEDDPFATIESLFGEESTPREDVTYIRHDHKEGFWICRRKRKRKGRLYF